MAVIKNFSRQYFFQQVRIMLRKLSYRTTEQSEAGVKYQLLEDRFLFVSPLTLDSPKGEVGEVTEIDNIWQVEVFKHGLSGAFGALPNAYTEWLIERYYRYGDRAGKAFLDIFNHRVHTLRFLAWQKYRFYAGHEFNGVSPLTLPLRALAGVLQSSKSLQQEEYANLFVQPVRSLVCLEQWLQHQFSLPVQILPFTGRWCTLAFSERSQLGNHTQTLGQSPAIGSMFWDCQTCFTVQLGPLPQNSARNFLVLGEEYKRLVLHIRDYVGIGLDFELDLLIDNFQSHPIPLGEGELGISMRIGSRTTESFRCVSLPVSFN